MYGEAREMLRPKDLSTSMGVTTSRIYQLIADGVIPHVRVGNSIRIPRQAWDSWLAAQTRQAEANVAQREHNHVLVDDACAGPTEATRVCRR